MLKRFRSGSILGAGVAGALAGLALFSGCATKRPDPTRMNAWLGRSERELVQVFGEPGRVTDRKVQRTYYYAQDVALALGCDETGAAAEESKDCRQFTYADYKNFEIEQDDSISSWFWVGCWGVTSSYFKPLTRTEKIKEVFYQTWFILVGIPVWIALSPLMVDWDMALSGMFSPSKGRDSETTSLEIVRSYERCDVEHALQPPPPPDAIAPAPIQP